MDCKFVTLVIINACTGTIIRLKADGNLFVVQMNYLDGLNDQQKEAVFSTEGPLLVLAGAGTGKTKVLTTRIAHIVTSGKADIDEILAITFTNKAAAEMLERINIMLGNIFMPWVGTFHSIAVKMLRKHGQNSSFTIIDSDDQASIAKKVISEYGIDAKKYSPQLLLALISKQKDKCLSYTEVPSGDTFANIPLSNLYENYQKKLESLNAMDFGDLLMKSFLLLKEDIELREYYQDKFKYILIDEYQDTNVAQYLWAMLLAKKKRNICCVGDDDQSIYGWRGAEVENILRFESDFSNAKVIKLQQNYRSISSILKVASSVISNNQNRHEKYLWTDNKEHIPVKLTQYIDDIQEARKIAEQVNTQRSKGVVLSQIAILVRAGYQTRLFEEALNHICIPYRIIGGLKFYERAEVKDAIAYIRLLANNSDNLAFSRIINVPKRGIGLTSISQIAEVSEKEGVSMMDALKIVNLRSKPGEMVRCFINAFEDARRIMHEEPLKAVEDLLLQVGYREMLKKYDSENMTEKVANLDEVLKSLSYFSSIIGYLEHVSLLSDVDNLSNEERVNIITMHSAKGLEFESVYLPGWEEGIFPTSRALFENNQLAEERRLAYVAITRAKKYLHISYARSRRVFGTTQTSIASRFLDEMPKHDCEMRDEGQLYNKNINAGYSGFEKGNLRYGSVITHSEFGKGKVIGLGSGGALYVEFNLVGIKKITADDF